MSIEQVIKEMRELAIALKDGDVPYVEPDDLIGMADRLDAEVRRGPVAYAVYGTDSFGIRRIIRTEYHPLMDRESYTDLLPLFAAPPPPSGDAGKVSG